MNRCSICGASEATQCGQPYCKRTFFTPRPVASPEIEQRIRAALARYEREGAACLGPGGSVSGAP